MKQEPYISEFSNEVFTPVFEYRGLTIYKGKKPIYKRDCNYVNKDGRSINETYPVFHSSVKKRSSLKTLNINLSLFGGDENRDINDSFSYIKIQIDNYLNCRKERVLQKFKTHRSAKIRIYTLNNVTITVIYLKGEYKDIFVNENSLRNVSLNDDFTFEDVLRQVYLNKIARYNVSKLSDISMPKYILDIEKTKIDLSVLPLYEYIGYRVKLNQDEFVIKNVWDYYYDEGADFRILTDKEDRLIKLEDIPKIELIGEAKDISCLINKANFYE